MRPILILQNFSDEPSGTIADYLTERNRQYRIISTYDGTALPEADRFEAVINLGCPISLTAYREHDFLRNLFALVSAVVRRNQPYLGICFGGQMLAGVLGARVEANAVMEIGCYELSLTEAGLVDPLFSGFEPTFSAFQWHGDTFRVPHGCELLVKGTDCHNQAFRKGRQVALQFHLETTPADAAVYCDVYPEELHQVGNTGEKIIDDISSRADTLRQLNYRLLDNFFSL